MSGRSPPGGVPPRSFQSPFPRPAARGGPGSPGPGAPALSAPERPASMVPRCTLRAAKAVLYESVQQIDRHNGKTGPTHQMANAVWAIDETDHRNGRHDARAEARPALGPVGDSGHRGRTPIRGGDSLWGPDPGRRLCVRSCGNRRKSAWSGRGGFPAFSPNL
jgi:hypothetical protein